METIKLIGLILTGLCAGFAVAASYVAFITMIGFFPKCAEKTKTAGDCLLYENCLILGILFSTFLQFFLTYNSAGYEAALLPPKIVSYILLILIGSFGGFYTGLLIGGLSEIINIFPILAKKTNTTKTISYGIIALALGKGFFLLIEAFFTRS